MAELISYLKECEKSLEKRLTVSIFGFGTTGRAVYEKIKDAFSVTVRDSAVTLDNSPNCPLFLGKAWEDEIFEDVLIISPSIRRDRESLLSAQARGALLCSDTEIFFKNNKIPTFAVTGSDGKSTTATLTDMLLSGLHSTALCGNIGTPF